MIKMFNLRIAHKSQLPDFQRALAEKIEDGCFIQGESVTRFENQLADYLGAKHVIAVGSGTDALTIALSASICGDDKRVLTTPFSFFASTSCIIRNGLIPYYYDIDDDLNLNADCLLIDDIEKFAAILPVHLFGLSWSGCNQLHESLPPIVHDCAQTLTAGLIKKLNLRSRDSACFSFFPTKTLGSMGDGGAIATNSESIADCCRLIRSQGAREKYVHEIVGLNSRLDALQAEFLQIKLKELPKKQTRRNEVVNKYDEAFEQISHITTPTNNNDHCYSYYTLQIDKGLRNGFQQSLEMAGVASTIYYPIPLHVQPALSFLGHSAGEFPKAESAAKSSISIPCYPELQDDEVNQVIEAVRQFFESP